MGDLLLALDQLTEKHSLNGSDEVVRFSTGSNVVVTLEADRSPRDRDSSRVQSNMLSDYKFDGSHLRPHSDRLLSVSGNFISYRLSHESSVEAVRVFQRVSRTRSLIKGFRDAIVDLAWSRNTNMLAVLDAACNLYVYHVTEESCAIEKYLNLRWEDEEGCELLKGVMDLPAEEEEEKENPSAKQAREHLRTGGPSARPRLAWCPYIPEEGAVDDQLHLLAITKGRDLHVINLSALKTALGPSMDKECNVELAAAREVEEGLMSAKLEHPITNLCLSPDATAVAVGDVSGQISFYIIEAAALKFAHNWKPATASPIKDLFFLDNLNSMEQFWRYCVAFDEDGRQLYLYECENWSCIGRLRLESSLRLGKFIVQVDPTARYIVLVDIDGANLFCVSLEYAGNGVPSFSSISQICFYHPLVAVAPFDVKDLDTNQNDFSFDEDDSHTEKQETVISLISITPRHVLHVDVTLDRPPPRDTTAIQSALVSPRLSSIATAPLESTHVDPVELLAPRLPPVTTTLSQTSSASRLPAADPLNTSTASNMDMSQLLKKFEELSDQMETLTMRVERADEERRAAATNESIVTMLQQFKEEFSLREDRLLANISDMIETSREETLSVVRNSLNENSLTVENSITANHKMSTEYVMKVVSERTKEALAQIVIPSIDRLCSQLFKQLNEQFKEGLGQYMNQMRVLQAATIASTVASTPAPAAQVPDRQSLLHLIKSRQVQMAFESVLNQADEPSLQFVCRQIDPDELFGNGGDGGLSQPVLLSLLQQLSYHLDSDTDLKFRYIEHILEALQPYDDYINAHVPKVVSMITDALNEYQLRTQNPNLKRQARVITQLVRNLLK